MTKKQQFKEPISDYLPEMPFRNILFREIDGFIETVDAIPAYTPRRINDQIKFYSSGTTYRLYIYDIKNQVWRYATLI